MSIQDHLLDRCKNGVLYPIDPMLSGDPCVRGLFVTAEINEILNGPESLTEPWSLARAIMDTFVRGDLISLSQGKKYRAKTLMGHLDPLDDGVWTMKPSEPKPGIRIFGQFADKDVFVAVEWWDRMLLKNYNSFAWRSASRSCKAKCSTIFNPYTAIKGGNADDYISNNILI